MPKYMTTLPTLYTNTHCFLEKIIIITGLTSIENFFFFFILIKFCNLNLSIVTTGFSMYAFLGKNIY